MQDYLPEVWTQKYMENMLMKKFDHAHYGLKPDHGPFNQVLIWALSDFDRNKN